MRWETFQFGRLYLDSIPQAIPKIPQKDFDIPKYPPSEEPDIMLGDTCDGEGISWIKPDGMGVLVADRVLLSSVGWDTLDLFGLADGRILRIDGRDYLCRMPQVDNSNNNQKEKKKKGEWESIIAATSEDNSVWNWERMSFWVNGPATDAGFYPVRGNLGACYSGLYYKMNQLDVVGFRPLLEPLCIFAKPSSNIVTLDGQEFVVSQLHGATHNSFYPQLSPVMGTPFDKISNGTIIKMYTLLCDGVPVRQDILDDEVVHDPGVNLTFTDKYYGDEFLISWVMMNQVAVAARPVLHGISPKALKEKGFLE